MQVLLFIGEDLYPKKHLQDLVGLVPTIPTAADISRACQRKMEDAERFNLATLQVQWATVLIVNGHTEPQLQYWEVKNADTLAWLKDNGYRECWADEYGWYGVKKVDDPR